jgi:hypothetical protein
MAKQMEEHRLCIGPSFADFVSQTDKLLRAVWALVEHAFTTIDNETEEAKAFQRS